MTLTEQDVRDIAEYARIGLTDDELSAMTVDLNNIIETLKPSPSTSSRVSSRPSIPSAASQTSCARTRWGESFEREVALSNSDSTSEGCFEIPSILGEGGDR